MRQAHLTIGTYADVSDRQLVVCRGLVLSQLHEYFKISVISRLCGRGSHGISCGEPRRKSIYQKSMTLQRSTPPENSSRENSLTNRQNAVLGLEGTKSGASI